jgi:hypothetical protein
MLTRLKAQKPEQPTAHGICYHVYCVLLQNSESRQILQNGYAGV